MANKPTLASTLFSGSGDDKLVVADVYEAKGDSATLLNNFSTAAGKQGDKILSGLKGISVSASDLVDMIDIEDGSIKANQNQIGRRASRASGLNMSSEEGFMKDFKRRMLDIASQTTGVGFNRDITGSMSEFTEFANDLLRSDVLSPIIDNYVDVAMIGGLIALAIELEVPEAIDKLLDKMDRDEDKKKALIANLERVARSGDLGNLRKIRGWIGGAEMYARLPNIVELVMRGYRFRTDVEEEPNYNAIYNEMIDLFASFDANWAVRDRLGDPVSFIGDFSTASEDTITVFTMAGAYRTEAMIAKSYPPAMLKNIVRKDFPQSPAGKWLTE